MKPIPDKSSLSLKQIEIFSHLSKTQLEKIETISFLKRYQQNDVIFYEGEESRYFHFLLDGEITIVKSSDTTETIAIHRFRSPSMIAEMATLRGIPFPASASCMRPSILLKISREPFLELLTNDPALSISIISSLASKISALELSIQRYSAPNATSKVARILRDDPEIFARSKGIEVAHMLGLTPETLSRILKKMKKELIIATRPAKGYTIIDSVKLNSLADNNFPLRG